METSAFKFDIETLTRRYSGQPVTIIGNGPTGMDYQPKREDKHIWCINNGFMFPHGADLTFVMDDLKGPAWRSHRQKEEWFEMLRTSTIPIITSKAYEDFPPMVDYPLKAVLDSSGGIGYFAETLSYIIAWATHIKVESLSFHGCDYYGMDRRNQRACTEFWLGRAVNTGISIKIDPNSKLMVLPPLDYQNRHVPGFYGYTEENFPLKIGNGTGESDIRPGEDKVQASAIEAGL